MYTLLVFLLGWQSYCQGHSRSSVVFLDDLQESERRFQRIHVDTCDLGRLRVGEQLHIPKIGIPSCVDKHTNPFQGPISLPPAIYPSLLHSFAESQDTGQSHVTDVGAANNGVDGAL